MLKRSSLRDVANLAGVSPGTVSNYLNKTAPVHPATQARIQEAIDKLEYRRNEIAGSLRRAQTKTLGMILPNVSNPFYAAVLQGAEEEARRHGYTITLGNSHRNPAEVENYLNIFYSKRMDGIILAAHGVALADSYPEVDMPVVVIEPPPGTTAYNTVEIDNFSASHQLVEHLISLGHRRIAIITATTARDLRFQAYAAALQEHGLPLEPELIQEFGQFETDLIEQGARQMRALLARTTFTACFATTDMMAIGAMLAAKEKQLRIPRDIAIAGFDDIPIAKIIDPPLTTIAQPKEEMGRVAIQLLLNLSKKRKNRPSQPVRKVLNTQLIVRGSTWQNNGNY